MKEASVVERAPLAVHLRTAIVEGEGRRPPAEGRRGGEESVAFVIPRRQRERNLKICRGQVPVALLEFVI